MSIFSADAFMQERAQVLLTCSRSFDLRSMDFLLRPRLRWVELWEACTQSGCAVTGPEVCPLEQFQFVVRALHVWVGSVVVIMASSYSDSRSCSGLRLSFLCVCGFYSENAMRQARGKNMVHDM
jgi:hypothetical protein